MIPAIKKKEPKYLHNPVTNSYYRVKQPRIKRKRFKLF